MWGARDCFLMESSYDIQYVGHPPKFAYDALTYFGAGVGCALDIIN